MHVRMCETYLMGPLEETADSEAIAAPHKPNHEKTLKTPFNGVRVHTSLSVKSARTPSLGTFFAMMVTMTCDSVWYQSCLQERQRETQIAVLQYTCYRLGMVTGASPNM